MKNILFKLWSFRFQFIRYFSVGLSAYVLDIGSLYVFKNYLLLRPTVGVILNQPLILAYIFFMNRHWSFQSRGVAGYQIVRFLIVMGFNYIFAASWMWVVHEQWGVQYIMARTANIVLAISWNFLLYKYWVYKQALGTVVYKAGSKTGSTAVESQVFG